MLQYDTESVHTRRERSFTKAKCKRKTSSREVLLKPNSVVGKHSCCAPGDGELVYKSYRANLVHD